MLTWIKCIICGVPCPRLRSDTVTCNRQPCITLRSNERKRARRAKQTSEEKALHAIARKAKIGMRARSKTPAAPAPHP